MSSHLIIGDSHAHTSYDNRRYEWLGEFIAEVQPDIIIDMGDGPDMPSLNSHDEIKAREHEIRADIAKFQVGIDSLLYPTARDNQGRKKQHKRQYQPRKVRLGGNHCEGRIRALLAKQPQLKGVVSLEDVAYGWEYSPFKETKVIDEIAYKHYFASGPMGRPIGGENAANQLLKKNYMSSVAAHSHMFDLAVRTQTDGSKRFGLVAGWYGHPDYRKEYWCKGQSHFWWNGVILLEGVEDGFYSKMTTVTQEELKASYG